MAPTTARAKGGISVAETLIDLCLFVGGLFAVYVLVERTERHMLDKLQGLGKGKPAAETDRPGPTFNVSLGPEDETVYLSISPDGRAFEFRKGASAEAKLAGEADLRIVIDSGFESAGESPNDA